MFWTIIHPFPTLQFKSMATYFLQSPSQSIPISSKVFLIGRSKHSEFQINHPSISKDHAYLQIRDQNSLFLKDMGSLNGTKINGQRLNRHQETQLHQNDLIELGHYQQKFRLVRKAGTEAGEKKKERRINLKDMFEAAEDSLEEENPKESRSGFLKNGERSVSKNKSKEKRINLMDFQYKQASSKVRIEEPPKSNKSISENSAGVRKPRETRIKMDSLNNFFRKEDIESFNSDIKIPQEKNRSVDQYPREPIPTAIVPNVKERGGDDRGMESELAEQRHYYQRKLEEEKERSRKDKEKLGKELERLEVERKEEEKRYKEQEEEYQRVGSNQLEAKKQEIDKQKKMIEFEAEAIGKEYQKIYKDTIEKARNEMARYQETEKQLSHKVSNTREQLERLANRYKQETEAGGKLRKELRGVQNKNKALLLYANHLQEQVDKAERVQRQRPADKHASKDQEELQVLRKLLANRAQEIVQLKKLSRNLISDCSKDNPAKSYQFDVLLRTTQSIIQTKLELMEYMEREKSIASHWQEQISINNQESSKVKSLLVKLGENNKELEEMHRVNTKKICEYHQQFYKLMQKESNPEKKKAGNFLVNQLLEIEDEKNQLSSQIQDLHLRIQETIFYSLKEKAETTRLSQLLFSHPHSQSHPSHLDTLHHKLQTLTYQAKQLQSQTHIKSIQTTMNEIYNLEIELIGMNQTEAIMNEKISNNFKYQQPQRSALDFFSNLFSQKSQMEDKQIQQQRMLETQLQRLQIELGSLKQEQSRLAQRYEKFKTSQLLEAQRLINS